MPLPSAAGAGPEGTLRADTLRTHKPSWDMHTRDSIKPAITCNTYTDGGLNHMCLLFLHRVEPLAHVPRILPAGETFVLSAWSHSSYAQSSFLFWVPRYTWINLFSLSFPTHTGKLGSRRS